MRNRNSRDFINHRFERVVPAMRYDGTGDFSKWQEQARAKLWELLGMSRIEKCEDNFIIACEEQKNGYQKILFSFQSEEGYYVPCCALLPDEMKQPQKVVICLQGHSSGMHLSYGETKFDGDDLLLQNGDRNFAIRALQEGYAAICMEQRYMGQCGQTSIGTPSCLHRGAALPTLMLGRTSIGERVWDVMRLIDVIETHFPMLDKDQVLCLGNSGGGTTTFYAACLDERIRCAIPSCSVCTFKDSIGAIHHCSCNYIPSIANYFDMGDMGGLIAPRALVVVNGKEDEIFPDFGVRKTYTMIENAYRVAGVPHKCRLVTGEGGHRFFADLAWKEIHSLMN